MRNLHPSRNAWIKTLQSLVKVRPSTRSFGSHRTASYKEPKHDLCKTIQEEDRWSYVNKKNNNKVNIQNKSPISILADY